MSHLANHFARVRREQKLSLAEVARRLGYRNIAKGCNRIQRFEERSAIEPDLLAKLAEVLGIDSETVAELVEQDRRDAFLEWRKWVQEPIRPYVIVRLVAAAYKREDLPEEIQTAEEAEAAGAQIARRWQKKVCLVFSRRVAVWFNEQGQIVGRTESSPDSWMLPYLRPRGSQRTFLL